MPSDSNSNNAGKGASPEVIRFLNVSKTYPPGDVALSATSFEIGEGEFVCLIGPSGCGKSTILKLIAGLESPDSGTILKPAHVAMVFQNGALLPWRTTYGNAALGLEGESFSRAAVRSETEKYLEMMGLEGLASKYPRELSGGERQRVGIARALAVQPKVLLLDEPFSSLDPKTTEELHKDLIKIWKETGTTVVMVSHLIEEAASLAERILLIKNFALEKTFEVPLPRPRREQAAEFMKLTSQIRKDFFKE